ncbi:MAG: hypothetical protein NUV77_04355, partial [Thermoguttaceae bacterium]|nr:hypothetical protein [Thermoguttaceae bacterium]
LVASANAQQGLLLDPEYARDATASPSQSLSHDEGVRPWGDDPTASPPGGLDAFGPCCAYCGGGSGCPPLWSTIQAVRILGRTRASDATLATEAVSGGFRSAMTGKSLSFDIAPGYYATLERYLGRDERNFDWFAQGGYWGFNSWVAKDEIASTHVVAQDSPVGLVVHGPLNSPFGGGFVGLDWANAMAARYNSRLESAELNLVLRPRGRPDRLVLHPSGRWQRECQPGNYWSFLVGLRYFDAAERFELDGRSVLNVDANRDGDLGDPGDLVNAVATGTYVTRTDNDLLGFQIGTDLMFRQCVWEWGFRFKVAPLVNMAEQEAHVVTADPVFGDRSVAFRDSNTELAGLIEFGVVGNYKLRPNLAVHAAYDIAWLTGVALAPDQAITPGKIDAEGGFFFQGLTVGLEWTR